MTEHLHELADPTVREDRTVAPTPPMTAREALAEAWLGDAFALIKDGEHGQEILWHTGEAIDRLARLGFTIVPRGEA